MGLLVAVSADSMVLGVVPGINEIYLVFGMVSEGSEVLLNKRHWKL